MPDNTNYDIKSLIPHRYPFLLIDRIISLEPGVKAVVQKNVSNNEPFFQGHFPQEAVMPGVLIVEAMAQAGACAILSSPEFQGRTAYLGAVDKAKFRRKVVPGDVLTLEMEIIKLRGGAGIGKGTATVGGEKAAEAEITFIIGKE
ncbi:MAG: 3-hydroxyacyl-ACP dehydratase FabZ [Defluviitaleaceae bacterium]|nr:3-hydroxyacyl-ACP dehydratase FabZ [Defluviitaleaceae bacterium]